MSRDIGHGSSAPGISKFPQRKIDRGMAAQRLAHVSQQAVLEDLKLFLRRRRFQQPIAQFACSPAPHQIQRQMLIVKFTRRQFEKRESAARLEMRADHRTLLRGVDHEKFRLHADQDGPASGLKLVGSPPVVHAGMILAQIDHQLHAAVRKQALLIVRLAVALVQPKQIHELGKRRPRNVMAGEHL